jgi:ABC-2 type transport system ATP-binding protein
MIPLIEVEGLSKLYGSVAAIRNVSLSVSKGEIVGFLGPNGAGKTTTMKILTCFMPPTDGRAVINGFDIQKKPLEVRQSIGYLPENVPLYKVMTVQRFLQFAAQAKEVAAKERTKAIEKVLTECGLEDVRHRVINHLSKGYRQRVGLAQALINNPPILILDEPTIGLDPAQIVEIRSLIKGLGEERTVVLSTHILPEASQICGHVIIINKGLIVATGTPENLRGRLQSSSRLKATVSGEPSAVMQVIRSVDGVLSVTKGNEPELYEIEIKKGEDHRAQISREIVTNGFGLLEFETMYLSLEDIFVQLVTEEGGHA